MQRDIDEVLRSWRKEAKRYLLLIWINAFKFKQALFKLTVMIIIYPPHYITGLARHEIAVQKSIMLFQVAQMLYQLK